MATMGPTKEPPMLTSLIIAEILASTTSQCPKIAEVYKTLNHVEVADLSKPYLNSHFEVYGTRPNGKNVTLYLTKAYSCDYGSRGGGVCANHYSCMMEEEKMNKSAYTSCEAICTYMNCDNQGCHQEGVNLSSSRGDLSIITADSFHELEESCQKTAGNTQLVNLYTLKDYRVQARYLRSEWRLYDTKATESNSCK